MRGSGQQLIVQRYGKQDVTITETTAPIVCPRMEGEEEEEEAQTMEVDLREPACEPADVLFMGKVSKHLAHTEFNKLDCSRQCSLMPTHSVLRYTCLTER